MRQQLTTDRTDLVRCLDCGTEYRLPRGRLEADHCPRCGGVGWVAVAASRRAKADGETDS